MSNNTNNNNVDDFFSLPNFDSLEPKPIPFKYKGKNYLLKEASHSVAKSYRSAVISTYQTSSGGMFPGGKFPNTDAILVAGCVFSINDATKEERTVTIEEIDGWPNRVTNTLFLKAREMSMLTELDTSNPEEIEKEIKRLQKLLERVKEVSSLNGDSNNGSNDEANKGGMAGNLPGSGMKNSP